MTIDLSKLAEPFPAGDIEWRVSRAGMGQKGVYCNCLAYVTARAIQARLDAVCGPSNWKNEEPRMVEFQVGKFAFVGGISIKIGDEWITKWDVAEPTHVEPAKGGFSGCQKRSGAQWGIARYLYHLPETYAEVSEQGGKGWNWAKLSEKQGGNAYYWKPPKLPAWALPKEPEHEISLANLNDLKREWKDKFAADVKNPADLREGFSRFVISIVGEFPSDDYTCWTRDALDRCLKRISDTTEPGGVSVDVPFDK